MLPVQLYISLLNNVLTKMECLEILFHVSVMKWQFTVPLEIKLCNSIGSVTLLYVG